MIQFEWDSIKACKNADKHDVSFEEAKTVFSDPLYIDFFDPDHVETEERFLILGTSSRQQLLIVSYTERGDIIRIISARPATRKERRTYESSDAPNR